VDGVDMVDGADMVDGVDGVADIMVVQEKWDGEEVEDGTKEILTIGN
jgi:hypothetical protein